MRFMTTETRKKSAASTSTTALADSAPTAMRYTTSTTVPRSKPFVPKHRFYYIDDIDRAKPHTGQDNPGYRPHADPGRSI
jgi:hypothetical protein